MSIENKLNIDVDIKPINGRIIVFPLEEVVSTVIFRPQTAKEEKPQFGFVIAIDEELEKPRCKVGDKIIFNKFATTPFKHKSKEYLMLQQSSILGVFTVTDITELSKLLENE